MRRTIDWIIDAFDSKEFPWFRDEFIHPKRLAQGISRCTLVNLFEGFAGRSRAAYSEDGLATLGNACLVLAVYPFSLFRSDSASTTSAYFVVREAISV